MPKNSDFPEYTGVRAEHVNDWNAIDYHKPRTAKKEPIAKAPEGLGPVKGMVSPRKRRSDNPSQEKIDATTKAAMSDWKNRGITNNEIIDY